MSVGHSVFRRAIDLPERYNAIELLERNLLERADDLALLSAEREMTFREVSEEVNRVGNALTRLGVHRGEFVAILCVDTAEWACSFFACLKIGAVAVGMNTLLSTREQAFILKDSGASVLLVHASLLGAAREALASAGLDIPVVVVGGDGQDMRGCLSYSAWIAEESADLEAVDTHREDFGTLNYSSGTTGEPKGILHAHKDYPLTAQLWGVDILGMRPTDRTFSVAKLLSLRASETSRPPYLAFHL